MRIGIAVLSNDADLLRFFDERKGAVVPKELRKAGRQFNVFGIDSSNGKEAVIMELVSAHKKNDAIGILTDTTLGKIFSDMRHATFSQMFDPHAAKDNLQNYFGHLLSRWIKNLIFLMAACQDGKKKKCLMLPLEDFIADETATLRKILQNENSLGAFPEKLELCIKDIRERSVPKKRKSGKKHFLKDDGDRYFELAKERHGQADTARPPHILECSLSAYARFGISLDREEHFNVSLEAGNISGRFNGCHAEVDVAAQSHLNIFPNGNIR